MIHIVRSFELSTVAKWSKLREKRTR